MNSRGLSLEIGEIDEELIEEAIETDRNMRLSQRHRTPNCPNRHLLSYRKGIMVATAILTVAPITVAWSEGFIVLTSGISNYISGIVQTPDDMTNLGSVGSLSTGGVDGLDETPCKYYTSFQNTERDLGLNLLKYSEPYELTMGGKARLILLQYFDYNESASISTSVTIAEEDSSSYAPSYETDFLTRNDGRLGTFGFVGEVEMELEIYPHPNLDVPVALVRQSDGYTNACSIYENVRYSIFGIRDEEILRDIVKGLK